MGNISGAPCTMHPAVFAKIVETSPRLKMAAGVAMRKERKPEEGEEAWGWDNGLERRNPHNPHESSKKEESCVFNISAYCLFYQIHCTTVKEGITS